MADVEAEREDAAADDDDDSSRHGDPQLRLEREHDDDEPLRGHGDDQQNVVVDADVEADVDNFARDVGEDPEIRKLRVHVEEDTAAQDHCIQNGNHCQIHGGGVLPQGGKHEHDKGNNISRKSDKKYYRKYVEI